MQERAEFKTENPLIFRYARVSAGFVIAFRGAFAPAIGAEASFLPGSSEGASEHLSDVVVAVAPGA